MESSNFILITLFLLLAAACKDGSNPTGNSDNQPPAPFTVSVDTTGLDPVLTWTAATDPDGDPVTYSVLLEGEALQTGLSDTTATLKGLEYETEFSGRVVASDGSGGSYEAGFMFTSREIRIEWETNLGGSGRDVALSIQQTSDGGYVLAGLSGAPDGDVGGNNGGRSDVWIVKLNETGNLIWEKNMGGTGSEAGYSVSELQDGNYRVFAGTGSDDIDVSDNHGKSDYWVVALSADGSTITEEETFGGSGRDEPRSMIMTADGGSILVGISNSTDGDPGGNNGSYDYWIVKLNADGSLIWEKNLGGSERDEAYSIQQTGDDGYIVAGWSDSSDGDVGGNNGSDDFWIVKLDSEGNIAWERNFGGAGQDQSTSIQLTDDGGYIVIGSSTSDDQDVGGNFGGEDFWVVKLDGSGNLEWEANAGGSGSEYAQAVLQTSDGGFIVAGLTRSADGDVADNKGGYDCWLVKFDSDGNLKWEETFGGSNRDAAWSIFATSDGGFVIAGESKSSDGDVGQTNGEYDYWIVKLR